ncbi:Hypothetical predicted protein [Paramuricea clavata]|uniref:Uncharacterized protein n=1 Tax=Paramuricea clavata TaxID=317549 RepID=A0A6S7FQM8_PARCT|nr:Hypothetical predicted protein [Paramuricea clavata]
MSRYDHFCETLFHQLKNWNKPESIVIYHRGYVFHHVCAYVSAAMDRRHCYMRVVLQNRRCLIRESVMELKYNCQERNSYDIQFYFPGYYGGLCGVFHEECYKAVQQFYKDASMCSLEQICINIFQRCNGAIVSETLIKQQVEYYKCDSILMELDHSAVTKCDNGDRYITIGVIHWLFGIYAELEIDYRIYPESFKPKPEWKVSPLYLPSVTFDSLGFDIDYTDHQQLTVREAKDFVAGVVDTLITFINENYQTDFQTVTAEFEKQHGMLVSKRLTQIMIYHQKLVHPVQDWIIKNCGCTRNDQICHCGLYTKRDIVRCRKLYFKDAGLLVSDAVYFTTPR